MVALEISHCTNVTSKYGDLALQVGGVSDGVGLGVLLVADSHSTSKSGYRASLWDH
jgi:hypothetical protein